MATKDQTQTTVINDPSNQDQTATDQPGDQAPAPATPAQEPEKKLSEMGVNEDKKKEDDMTVGEFIDYHALSSHATNAQHDMNNEQLADRLGMTVDEVVMVQKELGHVLPQGV